MRLTRATIHRLPSNVETSTAAGSEPGKVTIPAAPYAVPNANSP